MRPKPSEGPRVCIMYYGGTYVLPIANLGTNFYFAITHYVFKARGKNRLFGIKQSLQGRALHVHVDDVG